VPPTHRCVQWYTEMFRHKEERHTLPEGDLINLMVQAGFVEIVTDTVIMRGASLNNWLENSGTPKPNVEIIRAMHSEAPWCVKQDYRMEFRDGDCLMTWRFAVVTGIRPG
jgi:hypothetical protein